MPYGNGRQLRRAATRRASQAPGSSRRSGGTGSGDGLDWARRIELASVILASLVAAIGLWYSNIQVRQELGINRDQLLVTQEGQITDRYNAAVTNLGDDATDVRLGGIYALQRIMQDSPRDHRTISNVLAAFIRTHTAQPAAEEAEVEEGAVPPVPGARADVNAALLVLVYRDPTYDDPYFTLDLRGADLSVTDIPYGNLSRAFLYRARLTNAYMPYADLSGAVLSEADLSGANLTDANLTDADLRGTDLTFATLSVEQIAGAVIDSTTTLPPHLVDDPAIRRRIAEIEADS
ncbi:pentapeptide repeat-containing protein [Streptomyces sp. NBC_01803]|uniref:pentapeptide repeat-containing protein n=1 Tax=Streptomyces sp. NBC_01803 TaxID=2975946 RepID=UPI002DD8EC22|nr:pentapeptide repeat-containing protein [Streptomyces sp. NBC_01803]WSA46354.1 pentapeptide repeat-containing protein [Streptomyces sp. NBC_01803]